MTVPCAPPRTPSKPDAPVVAVALAGRARAALAGAQPRAAAVVLEAGEHARRAVELDLDGDVADQPRAVLAHGLEVDEADARGAARRRARSRGRAAGSRRRRAKITRAARRPRRAARRA